VFVDELERDQAIFTGGVITGFGELEPASDITHNENERYKPGYIRQLGML